MQRLVPDTSIGREKKSLKQNDWLSNWLLCPSDAESYVVENTSKCNLDVKRSRERNALNPNEKNCRNYLKSKIIVHCLFLENREVHEVNWPPWPLWHLTAVDERSQLEEIWITAPLYDNGLGCNMHPPLILKNTLTHKTQRDCSTGQTGLGPELSGFLFLIYLFTPGKEPSKDFQCWQKHDFARQFGTQNIHGNLLGLELACVYLHLYSFIYQS